MFDHLDDPNPPAAGSTDRLAAAARGTQLRHRRKMTWIGGTAGACAMALGVAFALPHGDARQQVATSDPTPTASEEFTSSAEPTPSPSPVDSPSPSPVDSPSAGPTTPPAPGFTGPVGSLPQRAARGPVRPCSPSEIADTLPAGTNPPDGVHLSAAIQPQTAEATARGAYWSGEITLTNDGTQPLTFTDQEPRVGAVLDGSTVVGGRPEQGSPAPPSPQQRTVAAGETTHFDFLVSTVECGSPRELLPLGSYSLRLGLRTDQGVWLAPPFTAWISDMNAAPCFALPTLSEAPPVAGLQLAASITAPEDPQALSPSTSFVAHLRVANPTAAPLTFTEQPGARLAYLVFNRTGVSGGWTLRHDVAPASHTVPAHSAVTIDVPVSAEACSIGAPQFFGPRGVLVGLLVERDGGWYHWTVTATQTVKYRG